MIKVVKLLKETRGKMLRLARVIGESLWRKNEAQLELIMIYNLLRLLPHSEKG